MHLIVGLGNPGAKYASTRHNIGWMVLDELARRHGIAIGRKEHEALTGTGFLGAEKLMLAKPQTYMNLSGRAVNGLVRYNRLPLENLLVVCDDLNLPLLKLRLRGSGSDGGQNGLKSVAEMLGTQAYARLRCGVGEPPREERVERGTVDFVLSSFAPEDREAARATVLRAADCAEAWVKEGIQAAMTEFNRTA